MASDFSSFYNQFTGGQPNYSVNVPPAPNYTPRRGGTGNTYANNDVMRDAGLAGLSGGTSSIIDMFQGKMPFQSLFGGDDGPNKPATGAREYYKGQALLNTYNWLLPYTAETVSRGSEAFGDIFRREAAKSKAYELAQFEEFAPRYSQAILNADPRQAALLELYNRALGGVHDQTQANATRLNGQVNNPMSSAASRDIIQASMGQGALQGFGRGPRDAALAYIKTGLVGEQLQNQRENQYLMALNQLGSATGALSGGIQANKSVLGDPFLAFAGRPGQPQGSNVMSPDYAGFNNDLFSYSVNSDIMRANNAQANSSSNKAMIGGIIQGLLSGAGGAMGGLCWVAREAFGHSNPQWMQFRSWLVHEAPSSIRDWYAKHGRSVAKYISDKPEFKARLRRLMEAKIYATANLR